MVQFCLLAFVLKKINYTGRVGVEANAELIWLALKCRSCGDAAALLAYVLKRINYTVRKRVI